MDKQPDGGCWLWTGTHGSNGYGTFIPNGKRVYVHRFAYELLVGPIPAGPGRMVVDHLCRVRACVNPDHLEVVTNKTNILRGVSRSALNALKTECPQGHPYDEANTWKDKEDRRHCRTCNREKQRALRIRDRG